MLAGVKLNALGLHVVATVLLFIAGLGSIVTVTVKVAPTQLPDAPDVGVTVYTAVTGALVVFVSVPLIDAPLPATPPVKPAPAGAPQVYVVPAGTMPSTPLTGVKLNALGLQVVATVLLLIEGFGFIVTVTVKVAPTQLPAAPDVGVTVYTAVTGALVVLVSVPLIEAPLPATPPVNPAPAGTPHEYVVPAGTIPSTPSTGVKLNALGLHVVATVLLFIEGLGLIVTVTVKVAPTQLPAAPDVGVTVYTAVTGALVVLVSVPLIDAPLPAAPPVKPAPAGMPHE